MFHRWAFTVLNRKNWKAFWRLPFLFYLDYHVLTKFNEHFNYGRRIESNEASNFPESISWTLSYDEFCFVGILSESHCVISKTTYVWQKAPKLNSILTKLTLKGILENCSKNFPKFHNKGMFGNLFWTHRLTSTWPKWRRSRTSDRHRDSVPASGSRYSSRKRPDDVPTFRSTVRRQETHLLLSRRSNLHAFS